MKLKNVMFITNKFKYSVDWFSSKTDELLSVMSLNFSPTDELHFLEIGSYEGRSTVWFLDNFLTNKKSTITCIDPWMPYSQVTNKSVEFDLNGVYDVFINNIALTGMMEQVKIKRCKSNKALLDQDVRSRKYNLIFIDGNHLANYVLFDAVYSWELLKVGGIMLFDDYAWRVKTALPQHRPKIAVDGFISCYADFLENIHSGKRVFIKKLKDA